MNDALGALVLVLAGRRIPGGWDRICRYCGLEWSGGSGETWAFRYYDAVETEPDRLAVVDVLTTAALHPGLSRADLSYFWDHANDLGAWITGFPPDGLLRDSDDETLARLAALAGWVDAPSLSLLTKVLHRKRPGLIPLVDREVLDFYRPVTEERNARAAWPALLSALRQDLGGQNALQLAMMNVVLEKTPWLRVSHLRLIDIVIWMGGRQMSGPARRATHEVT